MTDTPKENHANFWADLARHLHGDVDIVEIDEDSDGDRWMLVTDSVCAVRQRMLASFASGAWKPNGAGLQLGLTGLIKKCFPPLSTPATAGGPADELLRALLPFVPSSRKELSRCALFLSPDLCEVRHYSEEEDPITVIQLKNWTATEAAVVKLSARKLQRLVKVSGTLALELWYKDNGTPVRFEGDRLSAILMPIKDQS